MTAELVARMRSTWAEQPYPLLVEHDDAGATRVCPAATLWTGGRAMAEQLRVNGYGPGHRIGFTGPAGIHWVWAMLGCLREGCVFQPLSPRWPARMLADRLRQSPPHAVLDADGTLTSFSPTAPMEPTAVSWIMWPRSNRTLQAIGARTLQALFAPSDGVEPASAVPMIRTVLDDGMDAESSLDLFRALLGGAEVHVAPFPVTTSDHPVAAPDRPIS